MTREANEPSREERVNEIIAECLRAADAGRPVDRDELLTRHADLADELCSFFADHDATARLAPPPAPAEAPTLAPGSPGADAPGSHTLGTVRYFGDYELLEEIARGGMGVVFKARQVSLNRVVALKMILSGQLASDDDVARFRLEAQTAAALQHPNIVAIHEVGEHDGQHYFSMDFVEGKSLAEMVRDNPLPPEQAARWVRTVTEAIQYAHEHGVLHRDLKPSNVLIDPFGQPRVTDFGLAKRIDKDAGLTATGAVVGTPSYMPPEQASGQRGQMGPASDVYSLGAVLYELVTGRPPFQAATLADTLLQVLEAEPAPPRLLNPAVGRDLETIILKCLQKEPARRYASAQELADDLGALLEGRPIKARRPGLAERALRWAQTQRRSAVLIVLAATASALLLSGGILGWNAWAESRLGQLTVSTPGIPFGVEVFDEQSRPIVKPFPTSISGFATVFATDPVKVPAGDCTVLLTAPAARGQPYQLLVQRGKTYSFNLAPEPRRPWEPLRIKPGDFAEVIDLGDRSDIVLVTGAGLQRLSGATLEPVKDWGSGPPLESKVGRLPEFTWEVVWKRARPWLVQLPPIVDGDPLLVWASRATPSLLAASGKTGRLLWWHPAHPSLPPGIDEGQIDRKRFPFGPFSQVVGEPVVGALDGTPILVATLGCNAQHLLLKDGPFQFHLRQPEEWVEAIDARTGQMLWRHSLGLINGNLLPGEGPAVGLLALDGRPVVALVSDQRLLGLDLRTGKVAWSHDLNSLAGGPNDRRVVPRFGEFGSPREPAVLLSFAKGAENVTVAAISAKTGQPLWRKDVVAASSGPQPQDGPLVADLGGGGAPEVILSYGVPSRMLDRAAVEVLDGATGERRWLYEFPASMRFPTHQQWSQVTVGPDLDGDGRREVFVASCFVSRDFLEQRLFVEALSGRDGRPLWRWSYPLGGGAPFGPPLGPLSWWDQPGADGWPQLLVPVLSQMPTTFVLSAGTGQLAQVLGSFPAPRQADLDGDGIPDLWTFSPEADSHTPSIVTQAALLSAVRGVMPEAWRRLGKWQPAPDLDGDGVADVVSDSGATGGLVAVSGKDGHVLWQEDTGGATVLPLPRSYGDIDGDGTPDLLLFHPVKGLSAHSGKGRGPLWSAPGFRGRPDMLAMDLHVLECCDLDGNGTRAVLFAFSASPAQSQWPNRQLVLAVLSLKDGTTRWQTTLSPVLGSGNLNSGVLRPVLVDLDGDGVLDVVTWAVADDNVYEVRALSGRDGSLLWRRSLSRPLALEMAPPALAAGDLGGRLAVVVDCGNGEVWALDSAGERIWVWGKQGFLGGVFQRPSPVFLDLAGGGRGVCVSALLEDRAVLLDAQGRELQRLPILGSTVRINRPSQRDYPAYFWPAAGGLLSIADGRLCLTRGGIERKDQVWEWPLPGGSGEVMEVLGDGERTTVVVRSGNTAYGLDGATKQVRWRCEGPCPPTGLLPADDAAAPPLVLFAQDQGATTCRRALAVGPDGRYRFPPPERIVPAPLPEDPRLRVPLPWWQGHPLSGPDWPEFLLVQVGVILAIVLGRSAAWVFRRGSWVIGLLLCLLLLAVLGLGAGLTYLRSGGHIWDILGPPPTPLALALLGVPALVFLGRAGAWVVQGRWRRVGLLLGVSVLLTLPLAAVVLWIDRQQLAPTQHYTTDGWYSAWIMGAYVTGMLLALGWLLRAVFRVVRRAGRWAFRLIRPAKVRPLA